MTLSTLSSGVGCVPLLMMKTMAYPGITMSMNGGGVEIFVLVRITGGQKNEQAN